MEKLYDMHCHLDFADNAKDIARDVHGRVVAVDATVVPSSYVGAAEKFESFPDVHVGLGIHPWWIADGRVGEADVERFCELCESAPVIGEVGLDFHGKRRVSRTRQLEVLSRVLEAVNDAGGGKLVFLHAVKSYDDLFGLLNRYGTLEGNRCVFHWFSGSHEDFGRAVADGFYFSVGMRMLAAGDGPLFAEAVPDDKLLLETDNPPSEGMPWSAGAWEQELLNTAASLAEIRSTTADEIKRLTAANGRALLEWASADNRG